MKKIILLLLIFTFACKENKRKNENIVKEENQETKIVHPKEIKYVNAKLGLIFRDKPKGKRLGKFEFNEELIITEHTNVFQEIKNENQVIKGEWVGTKIDNKKVYVFDGFLSQNKVKVTPELIKYFMGENYWISENFKNILEKTKSYGKSFHYGSSLELKLLKTQNYDVGYNTKFFLGGYLIDAQDDVIYPIENIIDINSKTLKFRDNYNKKDYVFFNNYDKSADDFYKKWFEGNYVFKDKNGTYKYNSNEIHYDFDLNIDYFIINKKRYRVDKVIENTFKLSEIEFTESEKEDEKWEYGGDTEYDIVIIKETGKKATLTKL